MPRVPLDSRKVAPHGKGAYKGFSVAHPVAGGVPESGPSRCSLQMRTNSRPSVEGLLVDFQVEVAQHVIDALVAAFSVSAWAGTRDPWAAAPRLWKRKGARTCGGPGAFLQTTYRRCPHIDGQEPRPGPVGHEAGPVVNLHDAPGRRPAPLGKDEEGDPLVDGPYALLSGNRDSWNRWGPRTCSSRRA